MVLSMKDGQVEPITAILSGTTQVVEIKALKPNPQNPKDISKGKLDRLRASLDHLGYLIPILVNKNMQIIDGHQRIKALKAEGFERVEVRIVDLDEDSELLALLATDQTYGMFDRNKKQDIINLLEMRDARLEVLADYIKPSEKPDYSGEDEEYVPTIEGVDEIEYGDVIRLGKHVLICGSSLDPAIWEKIEHEPYLLVTSPPYFNQREYSQWDNVEVYVDDMEKMHRLALEHMTKDCIHAVNIGTELGIDLPAMYSLMLESCALTFQDQIIWTKESATYMTSPRHAQIRTNHLYYPAYQWEPIYIYKRGQRHKFDSEDTNKVNEYPSNVWKMNTVSGEERTHPAPYPVELPLRIIRAYTSPKDVIIDPFAGSGTTMIAAEQLNRKSIMIELQPEYCMMIINRWKELEGKV